MYWQPMQVHQNWGDMFIFTNPTNNWYMYIMYLGNVDGMYWAIDATRQPVRTNLLCEFHDINLCRQANVYSATSYQEMKNHQKNKKHLRSSCMQGFGVHFLYNFLMDFYDNEEIVIKQEEMLSKTVKGLKGKEIKRDKHSRFYFE
jgi:single-stranded DNA-specific DHH superfamily exonuclease